MLTALGVFWVQKNSRGKYGAPAAQAAEAGETPFSELARGTVVKVESLSQEQNTHISQITEMLQRFQSGSQKGQQAEVSYSDTLSNPKIQQVKGWRPNCGRDDLFRRPDQLCFSRPLSPAVFNLFAWRF